MRGAKLAPELIKNPQVCSVAAAMDKSTVHYSCVRAGII